ncbi:hypothetical protein ACPW96_00020 [Micromonospora sp. DT81.3]|uniref:hypothetical protein n=1 Tax=Micromonospora sp. DT81.3 TaxID=3416523 RepID=UPI003CEC1076
MTVRRNWVVVAVLVTALAGVAPLPATATSLLPVSAQASAPRDLGTLGGRTSRSYDINVLGQVTGDAKTPEGSDHAYRWTPARGMQDLGTLGGTNSYGEAINARGQIMGVSDTGVDGESRAFRWTPSGGMQDLGTLGGSLVFPEDISIAGHVTGWSYLAGNQEAHAFLWTPSRGMRDLGTLGGPGSFGSAINAFGHVAGSAERADGTITRTGGRQQVACRSWIPWARERAPPMESTSWGM